MAYARVESGARPRLLIFEPEANGHQLEWLRHLVAHAMRRPDIGSVSFLLPAALCAILRAEVGERAPGRIAFVALAPAESRCCASPRPTVSGLARWWVMRRYLRTLDADAGHVLALDHLSLPLAFGLRFAGRPVSGILFRPSVHYGELGPYRPRWRERLRDARKALLYRFMLRNAGLSKVLCLDPYFPVFAGRHYAAGDKLVTLRDPAHPSAAGGNGRADPPIPPASDRVAFVLFGYLTERKGVLQTLDALRLLPAALHRRVMVHLAGRIDPGIRDAVRSRVEDLRRGRPDLWLSVCDRHMSDGELAALVRDCHVVLAPYQRFVGSSGIMLWAAGAGRPLLTQDIGLLGKLTRDHRLGLAVDTTSPRALADAIARMVENGPDRFFDPATACAFAGQAVPEIFARDVFAAMTTLQTMTRARAA